MASFVWTDQLGRTYEYEPYSAEPIADLEIATSEAATFAVAEASRALGTGEPAVTSDPTDTGNIDDGIEGEGNDGGSADDD